jgi:hypothetical protein
MTRATLLGPILLACALGLPGSGFAAAADAPPPASGSPVEQAHAPMPANAAELDAMLAAGDYAGLNRYFAAIGSYDAFMRSLNWEQVRVFNGKGGLYLSMRYMNDLWGLAGALETARPPQAAQAMELKQTATFMAVYSYELILLDGPKCSDASAVSHRMDQLVAERNDLWTYAQKMPEDARAVVVWAALHLESNTAASRANDAVLCQGGMTQMLTGLAAAARSGQAPKEVANPPGVVGKSYAVEPPKDFQIGFVSPDVWRPQQTKLREAMPDRLAKLMKVTKPFVPPKP